MPPRGQSRKASQATHGNLGGNKVSKRRSVARVSCNSCRYSKVRCDENRPCGQCRSRSLTCEYDANQGETRVEALKRRVEALEQQNDALQSENRALKERDDTLVLSQSTSRTVSPLAVAQEVPQQLAFEPLPNLRLSAHKTARASMSFTHSGLEFELMQSHPYSYSAQTSDFAAMASLRGLEIRALFGDVGVQSIWSAGTASATEQMSIQCLLPAPPPTYCDARLAMLDMSMWTTVPIPNDLAAAAISLYLQTDHPLLGFFDADVFLEDLLEGRPRYCSTLLVSSLLFWALHAFVTLDERAHGLQSCFGSECFSLWDAQQDVDTLPTVSASLFLNLCWASDGDDRLSADFIRQGIQIAHKLDLFGAPAEIPEHMDHNELLYLRAAASTAWGMFNFVTLRAFAYREFAMTSCPKFVVPGSNLLIGKISNVEVRHSLPHYMGQTFTKSCRLWQIVNEIALSYYAPGRQGDTSQPYFSLEFAEAKYRQLLQLVDGLGDSEVAWNETSHHENVFRINYHNAILDIFRPFLSTGETLRTFGSDKCKPGDIFWASVRQLRHVILCHPLVHKSATYSIFWHTGLLHVANASLEAPKDPESQFFFLLCLISYHKLSASFPIMRSIMRGLLGAAVAKGIITDGMARALQQRFQGNSSRTSILEGSFMVDFGLAAKDPQSARAAALAKQFDLMVLRSPSVEHDSRACCYDAVSTTAEVYHISSRV